MTELILVRHGETVWHEENRYAGSSDISLTAQGRRQAEHLAEWARQARLDAVWASPLARARDTAAPVADALGISVQVDQRLAEVDFGEGEGLTSAEMTERLPEAWQAFERDPVAHHLPGGDAPRAAIDRAAGCLAEIVRNFPYGRVLVVGHSTLHRLVLCHLLGVARQRYRSLFPTVRSCGVTTVRWNGTGQAALLEFNVPTDGCSRTQPTRTVAS